MAVESSYQKLKDLVGPNICMCNRAIHLTENIRKSGLVTARTISDLDPLPLTEVKLDDSEKNVLSSLQMNLESSRRYFNSLKTGIEKEEYNKPYIEHSISRMLDLNTIFKQYLEFSEVKDIDQKFKSDLLQVADNLSHSLNPNLDELFNHFKYGNKNYIIFGKNGAGKTTLLKKITTDIITENVVIIPANRIVNVGERTFFPKQFSYNLNQKLADDNSLLYLADALESEENKEYRQHCSETTNIYTKFRKLFNTLGLERDISIENKEIKLYLPTKQGENEKYPLSQASDGEQTIVYIILAVLLSPRDAYIFIDEPENHLNGSLMRKLFDALESERSDARFIYLTHRTDFIETRNNFHLIYLEKTDKPNTWKFKDMSDYRDISLSVMLEIEGSFENIIFCEGTESSIDGRILTILYPNFTVRPSGSCVDVKRNTEAINLQSSLFRRKAIGVVDGDFQTEEEIESLKNKQILTLNYNEWESLLLDEELLTDINKQRGLDKISTVENNIIDYISKNKINILNDYLTKRYSAIINKTRIKIDRVDNLEANIDSINSNNKKIIVNKFNEFSSILENLIENSDYSSLIKLIPGKQLLATAARALHLSKQQDYIEIFIKEIRADPSFKSKVMDKIGLEDFFNNCFSM